MPKTLRIDRLVLCTTQDCNMKCRNYCLRGDNRCRYADWMTRYIQNMFGSSDGVCPKIEQLTFTGGEPALAGRLVRNIVNGIITDKADVNGVFIATNCKVYSQDLVDAVRSLYEYHIERNFGRAKIHAEYAGCQRAKWYENDETLAYSFQIAPSIDPYHEPVDTVNFLKYLKSGFYSNAKIPEKARPILRRGLAMYDMDAVDSKIREKLLFSTDPDTPSVDEVYISCSGNVYADCDLPYDEEDNREDLILGNVKSEPLVDIILRQAQKEGISLWK